MPRFFQHQPHPAVSIGTKAVLSLLCDDLCKNRVFLRFAQTMYEIIASASGPLKEPAHNGYRIFVSVPVDHCVFCPRPHFLPMERRKSRNNSFPIFSRLFSYLYSPMFLQVYALVSWEGLVPSASSAPPAWPELLYCKCLRYPC